MLLYVEVPPKRIVEHTVTFLVQISPPTSETGLSVKLLTTRKTHKLSDFRHFSAIQLSDLDYKASVHSGLTDQPVSLVHDVLGEDYQPDSRTNDQKASCYGSSAASTPDTVGNVIQQNMLKIHFIRIPTY